MSKSQTEFLFEFFISELQGLKPEQNRFNGECFGSWTIELKERRLVLDGKDACLIYEELHNGEWITKQMMNVEKIDAEQARDFLALIMNEESWLGSNYELHIPFKKLSGTRELRNILCHLFESGRFPEIPVKGIPLNEKLRTVLKINDSTSVNCNLYSYKYKYKSGIDIGVPMGALEQIFPVRYPLDPEQNPWLSEVLDPIFMELADRIYTYKPFEFALLFEQAGDFMSGDELIDEIKIEDGGVFLSKSLWERYRLTIPHKLLPSGLVYIPPNGMINFTYTI